MYSGTYYQAGNKDGEKEREKESEKLRVGGFCGYVNIETDGPHHIYLFGYLICTHFNLWAYEQAHGFIDHFGVWARKTKKIQTEIQS